MLYQLHVYFNDDKGKKGGKTKRFFQLLINLFIYFFCLSKKNSMLKTNENVNTIPGMYDGQSNVKKKSAVSYNNNG